VKKQIVGTVLGAFAGYLVMMIFILATFAAAFPILGMDRLFTPGTYEASMGWIVLSFVLGLSGAVLGGWVAAKVGGKSYAVHVMAGLVLLFGLMSAIASQNPAEPRGGARGADATMTDAMNYARQPLWIMLVNPLIGVAGVIIGGRRRLNF
jgi:hypothetical protein